MENEKYWLHYFKKQFPTFLVLGLFKANKLVWSKTTNSECHAALSSLPVDHVSAPHTQISKF